jgi:hypothetical protein
MKKALALLFASVCTAAFATPLAYDGFNYPLSPTNLTAQTTGLNWDDAGNAASITNRPFIEPGSLSYAGLAPSIGNSIRFGGRGMSAHVGFTSIYSNTVYYSLILKVTDMGKLGTGAAGVFFAAVTGGAFTGAEPTLLVSGLLAKKVGPTQYVLGVKKAGGGAAFSGNSSGPTTEITNNLGDVVFVVASYTFISYPGGTNDEARLWINPTAGTLGASLPPTETVLSTGSADLSVSGYPLTGFTFFNRQGIDEPAGMVADELTVGTSWADVTPTASALAFLSQPKAQRAIVGGSASFSITTYRATTNQWQHNGVDLPGANGTTLNLTNIQLSDAGTYHVIIGNGINSLTSSNVVLSVIPDIFPRLQPLWSLAPSSRPYLTADGNTTPNQRYIAYNALSNQLLIVTRTNNTVNYPTNAAIYVLNATNGADLYQMNADSNIISGGLDVTNSPTLITLNCIDVAQDGAVYAANISTNSSIAAVEFKVYRWDSSASDAVPVKIWEGEPVTGSGTLRWGNVLAVRGSGANTQILLEDQSGAWSAMLIPNPGHPLTDFWQQQPFANAAGGVAGGRTLLFYGSDNTFWEKHSGGNLNLVSYDLTGVTSTVVTNIPNMSTSPGQLAFNDATNVLCAINRNASSSAPDTLDQFDLSNPSQPLYVTSYNFPVNHNANDNNNGRVIFAGDKVFALDSNNGLMALTLVPRLTITPSGANVVLSWSSTTPGYTLKSTPSLNPPASWTSVGTGTLVGQQYFVTNSAATGTLFYRLQK